jgi:hypothetical protein
MVYYYNRISGQCLASCVYPLKRIAFRRLEGVLVLRWNLLRWTQSIKLVPIPEYCALCTNRAIEMSGSTVGATIFRVFLKVLLT